MGFSAKLKAMFGAQDMTVGKPMDCLIKFSVPLLIGNLAQQLYTTVDSIVVGQYIGDTALAAVGTAGPVLNLMLVLLMGISTGADIPLACDSLLPKVDCLSNLTDNTVVSYLALILDKANAAGKPVFGSEIEQVKNGCVASEGVEYIALGKATGKMAAEVLGGAFAGDIAFISSEGGDMSYNPAAAAALNITIPEADLARGIDVTK